MKVILTFLNDYNPASRARLDGIRRFARTRKWHVENLPTAHRPEDIGKLLDFWRPIGCIVESGHAVAEVLRTRKSFPSVYLNADYGDLLGPHYAVHMDDAACARAAAEELLGRDYRYFAFVPPYYDPKLYWSTARERVFRKVIQGAYRAPVFTFDDPDAFCRDKTDFAQALRPWLKGLPKPCGVFVATDEIASLVAVAAAMEGFDIPGDIGLVGVDNDESICLNTDPELTSVQPNFSHCGYLAAELIERGIRTPKSKPISKRYGIVGVVRRASTFVYMKKDPEVAAARTLIREKACAELTAKEVLATFCCTRRYAEMRFRTATGHSVLDEIQSVRLERIKSLLANPHQQLDILVDFCGYTSQNALRKFFKAKTGMTLSCWRKKHFGKQK